MRWHNGDALMVTEQRSSTRPLLLALITTVLLVPACVAPPGRGLREWRNARGLPEATDEEGRERWSIGATMNAGPASVAGFCCSAQGGSGRWCCHDGTRCCPPRALPKQPPTPPVPMSAAAHEKAAAGYEGLTLLVEEAVSGLLGTCRWLHIPAHAEWDATTLAAGANLRDAAAAACWNSDGSRGQEKGGRGYEGGEACLRSFAETALQLALEPGVQDGQWGGSRALFIAGRGGDATGEAVCSPYRRGLLSQSSEYPDGASSGRASHACLTNAVPARAFLWLKQGPHDAAGGTRALVPRHPRGQVMSSPT